MKFGDQKPTPTSLYFRDEDLTRCEKAWLHLLDNIRVLAEDRKFEKRKVFISYAWLDAGSDLDQLQYWLKQLQDYLERAGITVFCDVRDMKGHLETTMKENLEASNFVMPILSPKFLEKTQTKSNLSFEFGLTLKKAKRTPASILPILHTGTWGNVVKDRLTPFKNHLIYLTTSLKPLLTSLSEPLGLIPVIYGIRIGDKEYEKILQQWRDSHLTRIPNILPDTLCPIERTELFKKLKQGFESKQAEKPSTIQVIQGVAGAGKSQLAVVYAHYGYQDDGFVRWIHADTANLENEWLGLGELLGCLNLKGISPAEQCRQIRQALKERPAWLIILDNVEKQASIIDLLPENRSSSQQVLITTRSQNFNISPTVTVEGFTAEEAKLYCEKSLGLEQLTGTEELAKQLDYLPQLLFHAVSYLKKICINPKAYLERYHHDIEIRKDVFAAWYDSVSALENHHPQAAEIITLSAYLHPEHITEDFLKKLLKINIRDLDKCRAAILEYGLMTRQVEGYKIQRLLLESISFREKTTLSKADFFAKRIRPLSVKIYLLYPRKLNSAEDYATAEQLIPHIKTLCAHLLPLVSDTDRDENSALAWQARLYTLQGHFHKNVIQESKNLPQEPENKVDFFDLALQSYKKIYGEEEAKKYLNLEVIPNILSAPQPNHAEVKELLVANKNKQSYFAGRLYKVIFLMLIWVVATAEWRFPFFIPIILNCIKGLGIMNRENNSTSVEQLNFPDQEEKQSIDERHSPQQNTLVHDQQDIMPTSQNPHLFLGSPSPPPPTITILSEAQKNLQDQLVVVCTQGDAKAVESLLQQGARPDLPSRNGEQPLGAAIWGMCPDVVEMIKNAADKFENTLLTWKECEEHNFKYYRETFIVPKFEPATFTEWLTLLEKLDKSPFLQACHLKKADEYQHDEDSSSWENWKKYVRRDGTISWRNCRRLGSVTCTAETESEYAKFRKRIQELIADKQFLKNTAIPALF